MQRVAATYQGYMDSHKIEILELIEKGWQMKQIVKVLKISQTTLSDYVYLWANGHRKQKGNYIRSIGQMEGLPIMERVSSGTRERIGHNTVVNDTRVERPVYQKSFFGDPLIVELLDKDYVKWR